MRSVIVVVVFLSAMCLSFPLFAQSASVSGQVFDSQHAALVNASVTLLNIDTKVELHTTSSADGSFLLPPVIPGHYEVRVTANGFAPSVVPGITLEIGESKVLTLQLQIGATEGTVYVKDTPPELTTDRADRSLVIEPAFVANVPLDIRNPLQLTNLSVAVTKGDDGLSGQNSTSESRTNTFRINGAKGATTDILIDGAANTTAYYNQAGGIPGVDSVSEFRVYTDAYAPEFGRSSGGIVTYGLRSGSDQLHGSAFEYYRSSSFDANGFNANQAGQSIPGFTRNQFGATLGGPVLLPKLYDGHGKTFFFVSYEGLRDSSAGSFTGTVPTDLERQGDFSKTTDSNGKLIVIYDPSTTIPDPTAPAGTTRYIRTPFPGNKIPANRLDSIGLKLLSLYPEPNQPGVGASSTNNYFSNAPGTDDDNSIDVRIDHRLNDRHSIYGHIDYFSNWIYQNNYFGNGLAPVNSNDRIPGFNISFNHVWTVTPQLILEHHVSWAHSESNRSEPTHVPPSSLGLPANAAPGITDQVTPQVSISRASTLGNNYPFEANKSSVWQYAGDLSWLKGIHTFKFGIDLRRYPVQLYDPQQLAINASQNFSGGPNPTNPVADSGDGLAELLLGQAEVTSGYVPQTNSAHNYLGFYAQDIAKLTPKFTLTFGLRYSIETGDVEDHDQLNYLNTTAPSPIAAQVPQLSLAGGIGVPGLNGTSRMLQVPEKLHFDPRVGIAYQLDSKTIIHSGFGIFHHPMAAWEQFPNAFATNRASTSIDAQPNGVSPLYNLSNPFPQGLPTPYGTAAGLSIALGQNVAGVLRQQNIPYQINWSLDIQRSLPNHFVVDLAYAGNEGDHLMSPIQLNQVTDADLSLGSKLLSVVNNPFYGVITDPTSTLSTPTIQYGQLLRPFAEFQNFKAINVGVGHSSYNAVQVTVEHRLSQGLAIDFGYTFSKAIDNVGEMTSVAGTRNGFQDNYCFTCDRSRSDQNRAHVLRLTSLYELPFGKGKPFLNQGLITRFVGGWQISGIYTLDSGEPIAVSSPNNSNSLGGGSGMRPDLTGQPFTIHGGPQIKAGGTYFNAAAFSQTPPFQFGNAPRYLPNVDGPTSWDFDALVQKNVTLTERMLMSFRVEMFNAPNSVIFAGPTTSITSSTFGEIASLQQTNTPREVQLSARIRF